MSQFYKDKTTTEIRVGILSLVGLVILFAGYAWFREAFEARHFQTVKIHFLHAAGLAPGDAVSINGVKCGKVKSLAVAQDGVVAELSVRLDFPLHEGTVFLIKENNLMGDRGIDILPGSEPGTLDLTRLQSGTTRTDLNEFIARLGGIVDRADSLLADIGGPDRLVSDLNEIADTSKVLLRSANRFVGHTSNQVEVVLAGLAQNSRELSDILAENRGSIAHSFTTLDAVLADIRKNFAGLDRIVQRTDSLSSNYSRQENTVSLLLRDRELYDRLLKSSVQLDSLLKDVREHPKRYFKFSVF